MPNADRSMPSSLRPASREAATSLSTISRRTATTTTRVRRPPGVSTAPSDCQSRIASSIGIGMWSGACTLTAAASAFSSSSGGRSSVRTTIRWLAMPSRTRFESPCSAKKVFSASARAGTSATSPSRRTPGRRGATAPRLSDSDPLTVTSAAAMWPGSRSRPTIAAWEEEERFLNTFEISAGEPYGLTTKRAPEARFAKQLRSGPDDYQVRLEGQPFWPSLSQVRVTLPLAAFTMRNTLPVLACVTVMV